MTFLQISPIHSTLFLPGHEFGPGGAGEVDLAARGRDADLLLAHVHVKQPTEVSSHGTCIRW